MKSILCNISSFWAHYPALLYGLAVLLGVSAYLSPSWVLFVPIISLFFPLLLMRHCQERELLGRLFLALLLLCSAAAMVYFRYSLPQIASDGVVGQLHFVPESVSLKKTSFGEQWVYRGTAYNFLAERPESLQQDLLAKKLKGAYCYLRLPKKEGFDRPSADTSYLIKGKLRHSAPGSASYALSCCSASPWQAISGTWSFAEWRWRAKQSVKTYIKEKISERHSAAFLSGIITGDFDDRRLAHHFSRFGLQHIMAISGFHFSLIAAFCSLFLGAVFSPKGASAVLIAALSGYCFFVGGAPSVLRACIAIVLAHMGQLFERRALALNSLGIALLLVILYDPLSVQNWGFQFSFAITATILLFSGICQRPLFSLLPMRALSKTVCMDGATQHGYLLLYFLRNGLALALSVNLAAIPLTMMHFHKFPLMGVLYNLFFPLGVAFVVQLFLVVIFVASLLPFLSALLFSIVTVSTNTLLKLTYNMPLTVDYIWYSNVFTVEIVIIFFTLLLGFAFLFHRR